MSITFIIVTISKLIALYIQLWIVFKNQLAEYKIAEGSVKWHVPFILIVMNLFFTAFIVLSLHRSWLVYIGEVVSREGLYEWMGTIYFWYSLQWLFLYKNYYLKRN